MHTRLGALVLSLAGALALATPRDVSACGGFFARRLTKTVPSLQVEQVLVVHDPATEEEHFIRELVFRDATEPFGFVVPTPSRPTVAKVERSPFVDLAKRFPPEPPSLSMTGGGGVGRGAGGGLSGVGGGVTVLSQQRIGSFTAFVLAATDSGALRSWLDKNHLASTKESDAWLEHYVALGFYYVAFRYEMPASKSGAEEKTKSETVRISFASPLPFYPYKEPDHESADAGATRARVLAVWLMTKERFVPVAAQKVDDRVSWRRPWAEPRKHAPVKPDELRTQLGSELGALVPSSSPDDPWTVQTFEDQKRSRRGWGDVVLVPEAAREADVAKLARFGGLAASLDPNGGKP